MNVTLPNGKVIEGVPEGTSKDVIRQKAIAAGLATEEDFPSIEQGPELSPTQRLLQRAEQIRQGAKSSVNAIVEPALTIGSSMAADAVAGVAGIGQIPINALGLSDTSPTDVVRGIQEKLTYQPKEEKSKQILGKYAQILEPVTEVIDKTRTGEKTFQSGGGPLLSTVNEMTPDIIGAMMGVRGLKGFNTPQNAPGTLSSSPVPFNTDPKANLIKAMKPKNPVMQDIVQGRPTARTAKVDLVGGALKGNKIAKKAVSQGWDESFVSWAKSANRATKSNLREMVDIAKKRVGEAKDFTYDGRPSDILGKSLKKRIDRARQVQKQSGQLVDKVAKKQLSGKPVDISAPVDKFKAKIAELGGVLDDEGKLQFGIDSKLYAQGSKQKALRDVFDKIDNLGNTPDGYKAHELKQFIREYVDFGKAGKEGISRNVQIILKDLQANVNKTLKGKSRAYDKVNTAYSETTDALSNFQQAAGKSIDLFSPEAEAAIGQELRKLLTNYKVRTNLSAAMKEIEGVAVKHGGKYTDNLADQAKAVNEIERLMGSFAEGSFAGQIKQSVTNVATMPTPGQLGSEAVRLTAKQLEKIRRNQTTQLQALEALVQ